MEKEHPHDIVTALVHSPEMHQSIDAGSEGSVKPSSPLANELRSPFRYIGLSFRSLDVCQVPLRASFCYQFKTQDTIFGQEHVFLEDVHTLNSLLAKFLGKCMITMEILFQRSIHDCTVPVSRKSPGQDADVAKGALQRLIEDVADLVLEILSGDKRVKKIPPSFAQHGMNLTASATEVLVVVEGFPQREQRLWTRLRASIEKYAHLGIQNPTKSIEKPSVRVYFLAVLLLEAEYHLNRWKCSWAVIKGPDQLL